MRGNGSSTIRRQSRGKSWPLVLGVFGVAAISSVFVFWLTGLSGEAPAPSPYVVQMITVIDGDTVRYGGQVYRLVGFDTPERGDRAHCEDERLRADLATKRLQQLLSDPGARLERVACACKPGEEGTPRCNYGRLCGSIAVNGRDVGQILIAEGLAHPYVCGPTRCPPRRPWCS